MGNEALFFDFIELRLKANHVKKVRFLPDFEDKTAMKLGTTHYIDCAHFLPGHVKCGQLHGHTYKVEVAIEGKNKDGMVMDFTDMKDAIEKILIKYDHKSLNDFLEYPSVENICEMLQAELKNQLKFPFTIRVWEGKGKWAEL